ncbi:hypothetical protein BGZ89_002765 [Linnemannia elongata]|nr:hypothetical protein BGZ89_002765 [Linnemannia elongata]
MNDQPGHESRQHIHQAGMQPSHRPSQTAHDTGSQPTIRSPHGNRDGGTESVRHQQSSDDSMTMGVEERDDRIQSYSRYHERGQRTGIRTEECDEEKKTMEGIQDVSSRQREATQKPTNRPLSRADEERQERNVSPGSLGEASEPTAKISTSLSADMEFLYMELLYMGKCGNESSVPLNRKPGAVAREGVDVKGQQLSPDSQEKTSDEARRDSGKNVEDSQQSRRGAGETDSSSTREAPSALSVFADTAARLSEIAAATSTSSGHWTNSDLNIDESMLADRDVAQRDPRRLPTRTNGALLVLGQAGYYTKRDLEALFARWEEKCLSSRGVGDAKNLRLENAEGSKSKGKKLDKSRDIQKRKSSRTSLYEESNTSGGFEEEDESDDDDDDDDDDEDETESDKDEVDGDKRGAEGASGSSKKKKLLSSKRVGKGRGRGKDGLEFDGKKRKKLKSVEDTKRHACSKCGKRFSRPSQRDTHYLTHTGQKPHKYTQKSMLPTEFLQVEKL